ncbi:unnamed protein product [Bursaphelenchus xylophilus]|uniref:(pine wood nematode) hypothetical protein n=1 Tax=Bursaphelenchus xylophilus TaxID=6326 RepID=A0A1I7RMQ4_BURXY|nr:unnamed protein product [Bursaphelenchus xylophilus]CAG9125584.1 unnamed protein product [Bursaphelenchus xylophilus]
MIKLTLISLAIVGLVVCKEQGVAVRGQLTCRGNSIPSVQVKLFDLDTLDADDLMAEGHTGPSGVFYLNGTTFELTSIEPELRIYHDCNNAGKPCKRKIRRRVPEQFIYSEGTKHDVYNLGTLELAGPFENEQTACENEV